MRKDVCTRLTVLSDSDVGLNSLWLPDILVAPRQGQLGSSGILAPSPPCMQQLLHPGCNDWAT